MTGQNEINERRKEPRFVVNERALAFVGKKYGKIIDINSKGLSFQYLVKENRPLLANNSNRATLTLDISSASHDFCLTDLPVKIIAENEIQAGSNGHPTLKVIRCSIQFRELSADQIYYLKRFILYNHYQLRH